MPEVTIFPGEKRVTVEGGVTIAETLRRAGAALDLPCGGMGLCGECTLYVEGRGRVCACRTEVTENISVTLPEAAEKEVWEPEGANFSISSPETDGARHGKYVAAADIGTTTIAASVLDAESGAELARVSMLNPQIKYGADVISRVNYDLQNGHETLTALVRAGVNSCIERLCAKAGISANDISALTAVGNTCSISLFCGISASPLAFFPYEAVFRDALEATAEEFGIGINRRGRIRVLPGICGFIGADTVAGMLACGFDSSGERTLLVDIGTNTEIVLGNSKRAFTCSAAAGPAFEGASISCGMRGADGAIERVSIDGGRVELGVIGGGAPVGLCGSGLVDLIAALLKEGLLDSTGKFAEPEAAPEYADRFFTRDGVRAFALSGGAGGVYLTQKDVREFQLAKGAVAAGIAILLDRSGYGACGIERVILAGAFGTFVSPASACAVGLIPRGLVSRVISAGNAAGEGAKLAALSKKAYERAKKLAALPEYVELAADAEFQRVFLEKMSF